VDGTRELLRFLAQSCTSSWNSWTLTCTASSSPPSRSEMRYVFHRPLLCSMQQSAFLRPSPVPIRLCALSAVQHFKHFLFQLLRGLRFAHNYGVIHRDLKPANLLVTKNCDLCISDFGLARQVPKEAGALMTEHVVTRWYRAPELMLSADGNYTAAIDMWCVWGGACSQNQADVLAVHTSFRVYGLPDSTAPPAQSQLLRSVGCIFAELLGRNPLFAGKDFMETIRMVRSSRDSGSSPLCVSA
jgi:serine/threonine protein kinase